MLEGGYNVETLPDLVRATVDGMEASARSRSIVESRRPSTSRRQRGRGIGDVLEELGGRLHPTASSRASHHGAARPLLALRLETIDVDFAVLPANGRSKGLFVTATGGPSPATPTPRTPRRRLAGGSTSSSTSATGSERPAQQPPRSTTGRTDADEVGAESSPRSGDLPLRPAVRDSPARPRGRAAPAASRARASRRSCSAPPRSDHAAPWESGSTNGSPTPIS